MALRAEIRERVYAGVLGKIIGVYWGRPVEGWRYEDIRARFGTIENYLHHEVRMPLIVPDDDISGSFVFFRALEDHGYDGELRARQIGETWLNYIIEERTILWWGGMGRSTEHTAYLRLKNGQAAPASGSSALNGRAMAEQIGAQIFIDPWALANPGAPQRAAALARAAASVSHDGIAIECAVFLAVLEALAFNEADIERLLEAGLAHCPSAKLRELVEALRRRCQQESDWRAVRAWIEHEHGYARYPGNCPMVTNHLAVLMAFWFGGDDFQRSLAIAASAGWDTDCNAGNVGCWNGIRLGLAALNAGVDLRTPVADRLYAVSADGGECLSDAVRETRRILRAAEALNGQGAVPPSVADHRFTFEFPGARQGWLPDDDGAPHRQALLSLENEEGDGLRLGYAALARGSRARLRVQTFVHLEPTGRRDTSYFEVLASPTLYETQTVRARVDADAGPLPNWRFFIQQFDGDGAIQTHYGPTTGLRRGVNELRWPIPAGDGQPIQYLGIELLPAAGAAGALKGAVTLRWLDWSGAPRSFRMGEAMQLSPALTPWTTNTPWLRAFMASARHVAPDYTTTFSLSHPAEGGLLTIGTRDWDDYTVSSTLTLVGQRTAGLVARARGHRRYYAAVYCDGEAQIWRRHDADCAVLAALRRPIPRDEPLVFAFSLRGPQLRLAIAGQTLLQAKDTTYTSGAAGFIVEEGGYLAKGFAIEALGR